MSGTDLQSVQSFGSRTVALTPSSTRVITAFAGTLASFAEFQDLGRGVDEAAHWRSEAKVRVQQADIMSGLACAPCTAFRGSTLWSR